MHLIFLYKEEII